MEFGIQGMGFPMLGARVEGWGFGILRCRLEIGLETLGFCNVWVRC